MGALLQRGMHHDPALCQRQSTPWRWPPAAARAALGGGLSGRLAVGEAADLILLDDRTADGDPDDRIRRRSWRTPPAAATSPMCSWPAAGCWPTGGLTTLDEAAIRADATQRVTRDPRRARRLPTARH